MSDMNGNSEQSKFTAGDKFFGQMKEAGIADNEFIREIVEMFLNECSVSLERINQAFEKKDVVSIRLYAHKLKSSFLMFDMHEAHKLAVDLEKMVDLSSTSHEIHSDLKGICQKSFELLRVKYLS